jgi:hypothetical protein
VWWLTPAILTTREVEIRRIEVWGQPWQKVQENPLQPIKKWAWWHASVIPASHKV